MKATFAAGCFWCYEPIFESLIGVNSVDSGYTGGNVDNPTYEEVSSTNTGHAEGVDIDFDPEVISYETLVRVFFEIHDPTTLNRQGNDVGSQYRSAIFYHSEEQLNIVKDIIRELDDAAKFDNPIVTEVSQFKNFYKAEDYHQDFYQNNPNYGYCRVIIDPKVKKFLAKYNKNIKPESYIAQKTN